MHGCGSTYSCNNGRVMFLGKFGIQFSDLQKLPASANETYKEIERKSASDHCRCSFPSTSLESVRRSLDLEVADLVIWNSFLDFLLSCNPFDFWILLYLDGYRGLLLAKLMPCFLLCSVV
ncbi:hypothetical protein BHE74_00037354 [Ensete ventricosum]|nr:hypothetical protein BHE74_00037354 [Ensete ventricosum]